MLVRRGWLDIDVHLIQCPAARDTFAFRAMGVQTVQCIREGGAYVCLCGCVVPFPFGWVSDFVEPSQAVFLAPTVHPYDTFMHGIGNRLLFFVCQAHELRMECIVHTHLEEQPAHIRMGPHEEIKVDFWIRTLVELVGVPKKHG